MKKIIALSLLSAVSAFPMGVSLKTLRDNGTPLTSLLKDNRFSLLEPQRRGMLRHGWTYGSGHANTRPPNTGDVYGGDDGWETGDAMAGKDIVDVPEHDIHPKGDERIFHDHFDPDHSDMDEVLAWASHSDPDHVMVCETTNRRCRGVVKGVGCDTQWSLRNKYTADPRFGCEEGEEGEEGLCDGHTNPALLCKYPNHWGGWEDGSIGKFNRKSKRGDFQKASDLTGNTKTNDGHSIRPYYKCCIPFERGKLGKN